MEIAASIVRHDFGVEPLNQGPTHSGAIGSHQHSSALVFARAYGAASTR
jgi:hypothetical protein